MGEEVKLFGLWGSSYSVRVEIALKLKRVKYEFIEEDIFNKSDLLLKYNPIHKKIPVLLHNGKPIVESQIILEYIDETWKGTPILPVDAYEKAQARFWAKFLDEKCVPTLWKTCWTKGEEQEKGKEEAIELLSFLENELKSKNKKFFGGETVGFVDIVANFIGLWFGILQELAGLELLTKTNFPILSEWVDEFLKCDIVKEKLPPRDRLFAYFNARFQAMVSGSAAK